MLNCCGQYNASVKGDTTFAQVKVAQLVADNCAKAAVINMLICTMESLPGSGLHGGTPPPPDSGTPPPSNNFPFPGGGKEAL